ARTSRPSAGAPVSVIVRSPSPPHGTGLKGWGAAEHSVVHPGPAHRRGPARLGFRPVPTGQVWSGTSIMGYEFIHRGMAGLSVFRRRCRRRDRGPALRVVAPAAARQLRLLAHDVAPALRGAARAQL